MISGRLTVLLLMANAGILAAVELLFLPLYLGSVQFPITAALAAVTTPLLIAQAGRVSDHPVSPGMPLLAWLAFLILIGLFGPGGDIVMLPDWRTFLLVSGGLVPGVIMVSIARGKQLARNRS